MTILSKGIRFTCECGFEGEANLASDFRCVRCNGENIYSVVCPNCGKQHEVQEQDVPRHIKPIVDAHKPCACNLGN